MPRHVAATGADDPALANADLLPTLPEERTWTTYNFAALWIGMAHGVTTYLLASGLIALGMSWLQALATIALGNVLVLVPMLVLSDAGARYGIPFPVLARAPYGVFGANFPALVRATVACGWFGINAWIGGEAIFRLTGKLVGEDWLSAPALNGYPWTHWLSFTAFLALNLLLVARGPRTVRGFENWAAPLVLIVAIATLIWVMVRVHGLGPLVEQGSRLGWGSDFWHVFAPSLMAMVAFWAPMSLNMSDFTRFARDIRTQRRGQALGLPTTMVAFSLLAILISSGSAALFGEPVWDPVALASRAGGTIPVLIGLVTIVVATLAVNVAANLVSPAYDFANLRPGWISFRRGAVATAVLAVVMQPWTLLADPDAYIFAWLGFGGGALGAIAGALIADYRILRGRALNVPDLYSRGGRYAYRAGWNWRAVVASTSAAVIALGGAYSKDGAPFPRDGLIPPLQPLYDYAWAVALTASMAIYLGSSRLRVGSMEGPRSR